MDYLYRTATLFVKFLILTCLDMFNISELKFFIFDVESMLINVYELKKMCGITKAENRVTWPNFLHCHISALVNCQERSVDSAWPWNQSGHRIQRASEFRLVLNLLKCDNLRSQGQINLAVAQSIFRLPGVLIGQPLILNTVKATLVQHSICCTAHSRYQWHSTAFCWSCALISCGVLFCYIQRWTNWLKHLILLVWFGKWACQTQPQCRE